jgi:small subunit ribosomal protein S16
LAVKIRLARAGAKKAPFYRVIAADGRSARDGRFLEILGRYNPRSEPSSIELDLAKVDAWISKGAQPTEAAGKLIAIARGEKTVPAKVARVSKKVASKAEADKKATADAKEKAKTEKKVAAEAPVEEAVAEAEVTPAEEAPVKEAVAEAEVVAEGAPVEEAPVEEPAVEEPEGAEEPEAVVEEAAADAEPDAE